MTPEQEKAVACCAHVKVVLKHKHYPGGTQSDYWECADGCGMTFWPSVMVSQAQHDLDQERSNRMQREVQLKACQEERDAERVLREKVQRERDEALAKLAQAEAACASSLKELESIGSARYALSPEGNFREIFYRCEKLCRELRSSTCGKSHLEELERKTKALERIAWANPQIYGELAREALELKQL